MFSIFIDCFWFRLTFKAIVLKSHNILGEKMELKEYYLIQTTKSAVDSIVLRNISGAGTNKYRFARGAQM